MLKQSKTDLLHGVQDQVREPEGRPSTVPHEKALREAASHERELESIAEMQDPKRDSPMKEDADLATRMEKYQKELSRSSFDVIQEVGQVGWY